MNKRSTAEWLDLFEQHSNSGLSAAAFCREQGLCAKYFSLRRKQLHRELSNAVPIKQKTQADAFPFISVSIRPETSSVIVVQLGALTVNLPGSVEAGWLSDFVTGLKGEWRCAFLWMCRRSTCIASQWTFANKLMV